MATNEADATATDVWDRRGAPGEIAAVVVDTTLGKSDQKGGGCRRRSIRCRQTWELLVTAVGKLVSLGTYMVAHTFLVEVLETCSTLFIDRSATEQTQTCTTFLFGIHLFNVSGHHLGYSSVELGNVECFIF